MFGFDEFTAFVEQCTQQRPCQQRCLAAMAAGFHRQAVCLPEPSLGADDIEFFHLGEPSKAVAVDDAERSAQLGVVFRRLLLKLTGGFEVEVENRDEARDARRGGGHPGGHRFRLGEAGGEELANPVDLVDADLDVGLDHVGLDPERVEFDGW